MVSGFFPILAVASIFYFVVTHLLHSLLGIGLEKTQEEWEEEQKSNEEKVAKWRDEQKLEKSKQDSR